MTLGVTHGAPHHLVADSALVGGTYGVRRTRAGDAWTAREQARADDACDAPGPVFLALVAAILSYFDEKVIAPNVRKIEAQADAPRPKAGP